MLEKDKNNLLKFSIHISLLIFLNCMSGGPPVFNTKTSGPLYFLQKFCTLFIDDVFTSFEPKEITFLQVPFRFCAIDFPIPDVAPNIIAFIQKPNLEFFFNFYTITQRLFNNFY